MDDADADLLGTAREAVERSYAPYSEYRVGAALLTASGEVFTGCNVEVANYSNSLHAEEVALGRAVADGHREFDRIAVASGARDGVLPCGMCRQTLAEFCDDDFPVVCDPSSDPENEEAADADDPEPVVYPLGDLLPDAISTATLGADDG